MFIDQRSEFCSNTALSTAATGIANVGNVLDTTTARDLGNGRPIYLVILCTTTATSGGSATVSFSLASDSVSSIHTDGTEITHLTSPTYPVASITAGTVLYVGAIPFGALNAYKEYLGIQQNVGTAALTAGAIEAFLTQDVAQWAAYTAPSQN